MTLSGASYRERAGADPMLTPGYISAVREIYAPDGDYTSPFLSPLFGDFSSFPPTLIQVGDHEILYSDAESLEKTLRVQDVPCALEVARNMWHVYQMFPMKKAGEAMERFSRFLLEHASL